MILFFLQGTPGEKGEMGEPGDTGKPVITLKPTLNVYGVNITRHALSRMNGREFGDDTTHCFLADDLNVPFGNY